MRWYCQAGGVPDVTHGVGADLPSRCVGGSVVTHVVSVVCKMLVCKVSISESGDRTPSACSEPGVSTQASTRFERLVGVITV